MSLQARLAETFQELTSSIVPGFKVLDEELVPEGLNPHTRSICWLAEQVILQNLKANKTSFSLSKVDYPVSDISPWDSALYFTDLKEEVYVNIKVSDVAKPRRRNDIASVVRAYPTSEEYVVNKRNGHLQSYYDCAERELTNLDFCREVANKAIRSGYRLEESLTNWLH